MKCIPNVGSKKSLLDLNSRRSKQKSVYFLCFGEDLTGRKLGNTISNVAQGLVMTDRLILPLFRLGNTFSRRLKPSLEKAIIACSDIFWLDYADNQNARIFDEATYAKT